MSDVMTVTGPVPSAELGLTLAHEHVFLNLMREHRATGLLHDLELMRRELDAFVRAGGRTLVDCTNMGLGRDPTALREVAKATGLNIVMGCGLYRDPYIDRDWVDERSVAEIAELIVRDLTEGTDGTGIRAGIIGEIGADRHYVSAVEERSFRAAARAHLATGATITTHAARWPVGLAQLEILVSEGVDPARVIVGHTDTVPSFAYHQELIRIGAWVQYDSIRGDSEYNTESRIRFVVQMVREGHVGRLLLSHDVCNRTHLKNFGGTGYDYIPTTFVNLLREYGISNDEIEQMTVVNPRRALTGQG
jgi:predicted metal-dependent phosphotriesterase family hydrolase